MEIQLAYQWLLQNQPLINHSIRFGEGQLQQFFDVYNAITSENKTKTMCGRCIMNMKHRLQAETKKIQTMKQYSVYRTQAGNLTFKEPKDNTIIFEIYSSTDNAAKEALQSLKALEARENKKIDQ